jgi:hypothetical protein
MGRTPLIIGLLCLNFLVGCSGLPHDADAKLDATALVPGKSRILVYRHEDNAYIATSARIDVNGVRIIELWRGEAYVVNVEPGKATVSVDAWSDPGHSFVSFDTAPDTTYTFEVTPRSLEPVSSADVPETVTTYTINEDDGVFSMALKDVDKDD